ncbi:class I SAM-dependent methyltransferase [Tenggerimyces flavus]|uniref:Class I SAM-dependent methyltransferase n=1 Tax=Tenggerimyces flavus TaxID=1708749 RepID=A0ABV7YFX7_9ACTN|nr:class I SAM-dependent methyltransferase [Tenggerimyces flavus]MBM7784245.1 SAM-dependent methyltransferase [Tenggerimyces flavus]
MGSIVNTEQAEAWNGYEGEHWAAHYDRYDLVNGGYNARLLDAAGIGTADRVLDLGCGNGQLTRDAARRASTGRATGIDLSEPMLTRARERAEEEGVANVDFVQADAQVHAFEDASFDAALSRFGVMFFADPVAAFANVRRALRSGGQLAFACLPPFAGTDLGTVFGALSPYLPQQPTGADGTGPTSFADPERTRAVLTDAGFVDFGCERVETDQLWGQDVPDAAEFMLGWGPVKFNLGRVRPEQAEAASAALTKALEPFARPDAVVLRGAAWLVTATAP